MLVEMGVSLDIVAAVVGHEAGGRETALCADGFDPTKSRGTPRLGRAPQEGDPLAG